MMVITQAVAQYVGAAGGPLETVISNQFKGALA
jgi:hypothetical protein